MVKLPQASHNPVSGVNKMVRCTGGKQEDENDAINQDGNQFQGIAIGSGQEEHKPETR